MLAAVVHVFDGRPIYAWWPWGMVWLGLLGLLSFLMVCTWRYSSFKELSLLHPRSWVLALLIAMMIYLYSQPVLLAMASTYVGSGILIRLGGLLRRRLKPLPPQPEHQAG